MREMKDSGIEWIGEIPVDWDIAQVRYLFKIGRGRVIAQTELQDDGKYPVFSSQTKDNGCLGYINTYDFDVSQLTWTTDGANAGTVFLRSGKHNCTNVCGTLQPLSSEIDLIFQKYALEHIAYYHKRADTNGFKIMSNEMASIHTVLPPLDIQHRIADYLDRKCSQIDAIIARQQEVIEKLKAYKLSVITEAVTKGLNPDVPMKDSGVEWIGVIPGNWKLSHIGNLVEMGTGGTPDRKKPEYWENGNISWMSSGEINYEYIYSTAEQITELGHQNSNTRILPINTVMLGLIGQGKTKGLAAILKTEVCCNQNLAYLIADEKYLHYRYLFYCFKAMYFYIRSLVGESQAGIYSSFLKKLHIPLPDIEQQIRISDYLDKKCETIKSSIDRRERIIAKLTRYQKSLIYEVVTGKKEV